jgi:hypothetical protein
MKGGVVPRIEARACLVGKPHCAVYRRVSDLALEVNHSDRGKLMIWPWLENCVVHEELLSQFRSANLTGYRTRPATLRFADGAVTAEYMELIVTGWAGVARPESGIHVRNSCPACHWKEYTGLKDAEQLIDWQQLTGEDFFVVWPMANSILVTERVAELLMRLNIEDFELRGVDEVPPRVAQSGFTVGRLSDSMPEDVALKYGVPLGLE